jgi:hypothetical protein
MKVLSGMSIIIIPDISSKAVKIIRDKLSELKRNSVNAQIFDMTSGLNDDQLKEQGWYNADIEDVLRDF